jgi:hypothetical protein
MFRTSLQSTLGFYRNISGDILILILSTLGGIAATKFDVFNLRNLFDSSVVIGVYSLLFLPLSFPAIFLITVASQALRRIRIRHGIRVDVRKLRLADGMPHGAIWRAYQEHSLTLINETGHDLKRCYVMLDEVAWKNFRNRWEVVTKDVFSKPFKWNRKGVVEGKVDIDSGERASFIIIAHNQYSVYNTTEKRDNVQTDFAFMFADDEHFRIGYGSDIRMRISIRGKSEDGQSFEPVIYRLFVHLLQPHGIPKVNLLKAERIEPE